MEPSAYGRFYLPIEVDPRKWPRFDKPVVVDLDLDGLLRRAGLNEPGLRLARVVEVDEGGRVVDDDVPCQYDPALLEPACTGPMPGDVASHETTSTEARSFDPAPLGGEPMTPAAERRARLVLLLKGKTPAFHRRRYRAHFNCATGAGASNIPHAGPNAAVRVWDCGVYAGQESFRVATPGADYVYHRYGGGFASLFDPEGKDWISYRPAKATGPDHDPNAKGAGSAHQYRGIPNTAYPEPGLHPGYRAATTEAVRRGPIQATLYTRTRDGGWECAWDIYPHYATFTIYKHARPYWFLYEGTPGGAFDPETGYVVRSTGARTPLSEPWEEALPDPAWVGFGDAKSPYVLYLVHHETDEHVDSYWPMNDEMTVFGFGRAGHGKALQAFMDRPCAQFTVGFARSGTFEDLACAIDSAYRPVDVSVGPLRVEDGA